MFIGGGTCNSIPRLYDKISITIATTLNRKHIIHLSPLVLLLMLRTRNNTTVSGIALYYGDTYNIYIYMEWVQ